MNNLILYIRRNIASDKATRFFYFFLFEFYILFIKNVSGLFGITLRIFFLKILLLSKGKRMIFLDNISLRGVRKINIGNDVRVDHNVLIDSYLESAGVFILDNVEIHRNTSICTGQGTNSKIIIDRNTKIGPNVCLYGNGGLAIGKNVLIAGNTIITASSHNFNEINIPISEQGFSAKGIVIQDNVWIGANCVILDGVKIGEGSIIGSCSLVNKDIPPFAIAFGQPAKVFKYRTPN